MSKKTLCLLLALFLSLCCFVGCQDKTETDVSGEISTQSGESSENSAEASINEITEETTEDLTEETTEESQPEESVDKNAPICKIPEELKYEPIDEFFNDSVFIGYSIMMHFGRYVENWRITIDERIMGTAQFRAGVGMNFSSNERQDPTSPDTTLPKHNNIAYKFEDLPKAMGVKTLVIGLTPYSDMQGTGSGAAYAGAKIVWKGIDNIIAKNPDLHIIVLAGTYNTGESKNGALNFSRVGNKYILMFNEYILDYCTVRGLDFVDVATPLLNGNGYFVKEWASDGSYHIKPEPYKLWIKALRDYAEQKQAGIWKNMEDMPPLVKE